MSTAGRNNGAPMLYFATYARKSTDDLSVEENRSVERQIACYLEGHKKLGRRLPRRRARVEIVRVNAA